MSNAKRNADNLSKWAVGPQTPIAASKMRIDNLFESSSFKLEDETGIWAEQTYTAWGFSQEFTATSVPAAGGSPLATGFFYANNNGCPGDVVALMGSAIARTSNAVVFGANILARNSPGNTNTKLVGMEIDLQPTAGTTVNSGSAGLFINAFNVAMPAPAIQIGFRPGGSFSDGVVISGIREAGLSPDGAATMKSLVNSGAGVFSEAAIVLSNNHRIRFGGTGSAHAFLYNDASDNVRMIAGAGNRWTLRNNADTTSLVTLLDVGGQGVVNIETSGGEYRVNSTKVLGARVTGWALPTGTLSRATFNPATATTEQIGQRLAALITDFYSSHGAIGA
jgi:hypothetical protein